MGGIILSGMLLLSWGSGRSLHVVCESLKLKCRYTKSVMKKGKEKRFIRVCNALCTSNVGGLKPLDMLLLSWGSSRSCAMEAVAQGLNASNQEFGEAE